MKPILKYRGGKSREIKYFNGFWQQLYVKGIQIAQKKKLGFLSGPDY